MVQFEPLRSVRELADKLIKNPSRQLTQRSPSALIPPPGMTQ